MQVSENPWRRDGLAIDALAEVPAPSVNAALAEAVVAEHLIGGETPLVRAEGFGPEVWVKDERTRMGLGSFKALGAAYVIAHHAADAGEGDLSSALKGGTYVTASAGNHGLSLAFGATRFGARAVVYIAETVPESFADRLRGQGADVRREGAEYEASMAAAAETAEAEGWTLLSDSSWPGYYELPYRLMEGYTAMAAEAARQIPAPPSHIFLQCGVGGLSAACAAYFRSVWADEPQIINVEPDTAAALQVSIAAGAPAVANGPVSCMGRLDCKEPSLIALKGLARDADLFATITEDEAKGILPELADAGLASTPSGAAGLAALKLMDLPADARVLCFLSEKADE
ncbi:MAG: pyridoxal-phosphate dependent enzyme [Pseudomonadota bacterium]